MKLEVLPGEIIAECLAELDVPSLITVSQLSRRLCAVASDSALNPWRRPILADLRSRNYDALKHLSVRSSVPRHNWVEILTLAPPSFLLFDATLPNLPAADWEEAFARRFLPSWRKWKKDGSWKEAFMKLLYRMWHRGSSSCTIDEAWTKYIVLNRNGSANELEASSRTFNPVTIFNAMKHQSNLAHLETHVKVIVEFTDFRIVAFGAMERPRRSASINVNAHLLLNPPGMEPSEKDNSAVRQQAPVHQQNSIDDRGVNPIFATATTSAVHQLPISSFTYNQLIHPTPSIHHANYPFYTPGGSDHRWSDLAEIDNGGRWVGGVMLTAQLLGPYGDDPVSHHQYASFCWCDLWKIAPWLEEIITLRIDGQGLGH